MRARWNEQGIDLRVGGSRSKKRPQGPGCKSLIAAELNRVVAKLDDTPLLESFFGQSHLSIDRCLLSVAIGHTAVLISRYDDPSASLPPAFI